MYKEIKRTIRLRYLKVKNQFVCAFKYHTYNGNIKLFIQDLFLDSLRDFREHKGE